MRRTSLAFLLAFLVSVPAWAGNLADRILDIDAKVKPVTREMRQRLAAWIDQACAAIRKLPPKAEGWDEAHVNAVFKCIDDTLVENGVVYPDVGLVDELADCLTPFNMKPERKAAFEAGEHNARRVGAIEKRFPGPFFVADCDIASFVYLCVADRMKLPIHMVDLPAYGLGFGHNFVRWREGDNFVDWETMDGCAKPDWYYRSLWHISKEQIDARVAMVDMTTEEVVGYVHGLASIQYDRRGDYKSALREIALSLKLYPTDLLMANNFAWDTAVGKNLKKRDLAAATRSAQFVLMLHEDPNVRDTLAAVYAASGQFDLAVKEESAAAAAIDDSSFKERLELYKQRKAFTQDREIPRKDSVFHP